MEREQRGQEDVGCEYKVGTMRCGQESDGRRERGWQMGHLDGLVVVRLLVLVLAVVGRVFAVVAGVLVLWVAVVRRVLFLRLVWHRLRHWVGFGDGDRLRHWHRNGNLLLVDDRLRLLEQTVCLTG